MSVEWTNESVIQLVAEYRRRAELWDRSHELHNVQTAKYEAWTAMARFFQCDIADIRQKITSVLASYRREKGKVRKGIRSRWFLYPYLQFLKGYLKSPHTSVPKKSSGTKSEPIEPYTMEADHIEDVDDEVLIKLEPEPEPSPMKKAMFARQKHNRRLTKMKRLPERESSLKEPNLSTHTDSKLLEMLKLLKKSDISKKKDECDSFGEYIATALRKHDDRTQSMIKQAINNILFEQEMKKYTNFSVVVSPENPLDIVIGDDLDDSNDDKISD